jgi:hypothetical protein
MQEGQQVFRSNDCNASFLTLEFLHEPRLVGAENTSPNLSLHFPFFSPGETEPVV